MAEKGRRLTLKETAKFLGTFSKTKLNIEQATNQIWNIITGGDSFDKADIRYIIERLK